MINGKSLSTINADLIGRLQKYIQGFSLILEYEENLRKAWENISKCKGEGQIEVAPGPTLHPLVETALQQYSKRSCTFAHCDTSSSHFRI